MSKVIKDECIAACIATLRAEVKQWQSMADSTIETNQAMGKKLLALKEALETLWKAKEEKEMYGKTKRYMQLRNKGWNLTEMVLDNE